MQRWQDDSTMTRKILRRDYLIALAALCAIALGGTPARASTVAAQQACAGEGGADPFSLYGDEIRFGVRRNGTLVGSHTLSFAREGEQITTTTRFEVAVDLLFFTAYRYVYASEGTWSSGCLVGLAATTDDNGKESIVRVYQEGRGLSVYGPQGMVTADRQTLPTEHWDRAVVNRDAVINTITGRINSVEITPAGFETVRAADGRAITAQRYVYRGELDTRCSTTRMAGG